MSDTRTGSPSRWSGATGVLAILTGAVVLTGCFALLLIAFRGESEDEAKADFCDSLSDFAATVEQYEQLDPQTATNDELDNAHDDVRDAWDEVLDEGSEWVSAYDDQLTDAYGDLDDALRELPGDDTLPDSVDEPELSALPAAFEETFDGTGCSAS